MNALSLAAYDDVLDLDLVAPVSRAQLARAAAVVHADADASRPACRRFLCLASDGRVAREFDDPCDALAWQRSTVRAHFVISDDGRLLAIPPVMGAMKAAELAVARWREKQVPTCAASEVRLAVGR